MKPPDSETEIAPEGSHVYPTYVRKKPLFFEGLFSYFALSLEAFFISFKSFDFILVITIFNFSFSNLSFTFLFVLNSDVSLSDGDNL